MIIPVMKNKIKHIFSAFVVFAMVVSLTACGEDVTLESRSVNGITLSVPSDFNAFADNNGMQMATDENSTATIVISAKGDAQGIKASDYNQDSYQQAYLGSYSDVSIEKFDNNAELDGNTTLLAQIKGTNDAGIKVVVYNYITFFEDGTCQSISLSFSADNDSSLKTNIDNITKSVKFE